MFVGQIKKFQRILFYYSCTCDVSQIRKKFPFYKVTCLDSNFYYQIISVHDFSPAKECSEYKFYVCRIKTIYQIVSPQNIDFVTFRYISQTAVRNSSFFFSFSPRYFFFLLNTAFIQNDFNCARLQLLLPFSSQIHFSKIMKKKR